MRRLRIRIFSWSAAVYPPVADSTRLCLNLLFKTRNLSLPTRNPLSCHSEEQRDEESAVAVNVSLDVAFYEVRRVIAALRLHLFFVGARYAVPVLPHSSCLAALADCFLVS